MTTVIIGAGHAGVQAAESLRLEGFEGRIVLLEQSEHLPYQRPPLSKDFMQVETDPLPLPLRGRAFYDQQGIELRLGTSVSAIDTANRTVRTAAGESVDYEQLVLAVGVDARRAECEGSELDGIEYLRTLDHAVALRSKLRGGHRRVVVVGAGFIGLEFAAVAAGLGLEVTVIDFVERPMQRVLTPSMSEYFATVHERLGVELRFGEGLDRFTGVDGRVTAVVGTSGTVYPCDFAVVGLGVVAADPLAEGVAFDRGVVVDEFLRTSDPHVYAIGDIAVFPSERAGTSLRLESVQNATEMAKTVAKTICGRPTRYERVPWFWSHQGDAGLKIVGLAAADDAIVMRGDRAGGKFSQFAFRDGVLVAVESVNAPGDHVAARKLLDRDITITPEDVRDPGFDLKRIANGADRAGAVSP